MCRIDLHAVEKVVGDLGPVPDGKSFLTSVLKMRMQIYILKDFNKSPRLVDALFRLSSTRAQ